MKPLLAASLVFSSLLLTGCETKTMQEEMQLITYQKCINDFTVKLRKSDEPEETTVSVYSDSYSFSKYARSRVESCAHMLGLVSPLKPLEIDPLTRDEIRELITPKKP